MYGRTAAFHQVKRSRTDLKVYKSIPEEDDAYALQDMVHNTCMWTGASTRRTRRSTRCSTWRFGA